MTTFIQRLATGIVFSALLLPSVTFAAQSTSAPSYSPQYIATLQKLLTLLEAELAAITAQQSTPQVATTTASAAIVPASTATTTITATFTPQPSAQFTRDGLTYDYISSLDMYITAHGHPAYIPLNLQALAYYTAPANPNLKVNVSLTCNADGLLVNASGGAEFCMIQPEATARISTTFDYTTTATSTHSYAFGISSVNYSDNITNVVFSSYLPTTSVTTKPNL